MRALVQFAGDDQPARVYRQDASTMFRLGADTASIANLHGISEARVLKRVTLERCKRLGLPSPYGESI